MQLRLSGQPGFTELPDTGLETNDSLPAAVLQGISEDAAFAAVRTEEFWGYYANGETVKLPMSPVDGYRYSRAECCYTWSIYWTGSATAPLEGTQVAPSRGPTSSGGHLLKIGGFIDQATGLVSCDEAYEKEAMVPVPEANHDGILLVITHAKRLR
jgi:hypothetical protein